MNLKAILESKGLIIKDASLHGKDELRINCPFCLDITGSNDTKFHLYASPYSLKFKCFRCATAGSVVKLLKRLDITLTGLTRSLRDCKIKEQKPCISSSLFSRSKMASLARSYLEARGISNIDIIHYGMSLGSDDYAGRIIVPVSKGFVARTFIRIEPRYLSTTKSPFYNKYVKRGETILLVEGIFDAIKIPIGCLALLGKELTQEQYYILRSLDPKRVGIWLDGDVSPLHIKTMQRRLEDIGIPTVIVLSSSKDPGSSTTINETLKEYNLL